MSLIDRLSDRLGALLDDVRLPDRVDRALRDAERAIADGHADAALATLEQVESERAGLWRTAFLSGLAYEQRGDLQQAAARLSRAAEARDLPLVRLALGRVAEQLGDLRTAREHFEQAIDRRPDEHERRELLRGLAGVHEAMGHPARAIPALRQLSRLEPLDAEIRVRLAHALRDDGDLHAAIESLADAASQEEVSVEVLRLAGALHLERSAGAVRTDLEAAGRYYEAARAVRPEDPEALEGLAQVAQAQGRVADALPLLHQALASAPLDAHARLQRRIGSCYLGSSERERALDAFRASIALDDRDADAALLAARVALDLAFGQEADEAAQLALAQRPSDPTVRAIAGRARLAIGDVDGARAALSSLRAVQMSVDVLHALGELALRSGDAIEALALLREAAVRQPGRFGVDALLREASASLTPALPALGPIRTLAPPKLAPFLDALSEAVASHPLLTNLIPRATALRQHLDTPLTVAVLGEFNAGKSTLINAFVGEPMVAMGVLPTTSHVNVIRYGPRKIARWTRLDGEVEEIPFADAVKLVKREPESIEQLEFCYPHPDLRSVHFWDTPGFNAPDDAHEERAQHALRTADAVVWMIDANQALTMSEFSRLDEVPSRDEKLLIVLNKVDRLGDDHDARVEIEQHVRGHLGDDIAGLFFLSTREALESRAAGPDAPVPAATGWPAFERALHERVFDRAGRLKSLEVVRGLEDLLEESIDRAERLRAELSRASERVRASRTSITEQRARWSDDVTGAALDSATSQLRAVRTRAARDVAQLATPQPGLFSRPRLAAADRDLIKEQLVDRASDAWSDAVSGVRAATASLDDSLVQQVESVASTLAPGDARTLRRRLEAWLAESDALHRLLDERAVVQPCGLVRARVDEIGDMVLERLGSDPGRTEAERESHLHRLVPGPDATIGARLDAWGEEYLDAARRLSDHVERDLDILALDLEQRILRPFRAVLTALRPDDAP